MRLIDTMRAFVLELAETGSKGYRWLVTAARYQDIATGRFVAEKTVLRRVDKMNDEKVVSVKIGAITDRFIKDKGYKIQNWQEDMKRQLKDAFIINATIGRGGKNAMTPQDWGRVGGRLAYEYGRLNNFAAQIAKGEYSPEYIKNRASLYAGGPRTAYFDALTRAKAGAGMSEERRILEPGADHCGDCPDLAAMGWQPIGTLPEPGVGTECGHRCRCSKEYR